MNAWHTFNLFYRMETLFIANSNVKNFDYIDLEILDNFNQGHFINIQILFLLQVVINFNWHDKEYALPLVKIARRAERNPFD